ncbi:unnamed protein product [Polarella glacialis]|uniref:Uncharacterized protein n=1 Tax=Polarella glacialis TaxID=89957 RepID=A0A813HLD1_POLGL|nr:unnamed protein product [Polarella glacialis]
MFCFNFMLMLGLPLLMPKRVSGKQPQDKQPKEQPKDKKLKVGAAEGAPEVAAKRSDNLAKANFNTHGLLQAATWPATSITRHSADSMQKKQRSLKNGQLTKAASGSTNIRCLTIVVKRQSQEWSAAGAQGCLALRFHCAGLCFFWLMHGVMC